MVLLCMSMCVQSDSGGCGHHLFCIVPKPLSPPTMLSSCNCVTTVHAVNTIYFCHYVTLSPLSVLPLHSTMSVFFTCQCITVCCLSLWCQVPRQTAHCSTQDHLICGGTHKDEAVKVQVGKVSAFVHFYSATLILV